MRFTLIVDRKLMFGGKWLQEEPSLSAGVREQNSSSQRVITLYILSVSDRFSFRCGFFFNFSSFLEFSAFWWCGLGRKGGGVGC